MKNIRNFILIALLIIVILGSILMFFWVNALSHDMARWNPQISYIRVPILILSYLILGSIVAALVSGLILVIKSTRKNIFEPRTIKTLACMGHLLSLAAISVIVIYVYSYLQIQNEIGLLSVYMVAAVIMFLLGACIMYFIADLFRKAVTYKEDVDLTV